MKISIKVSDINHDNLVDLFSTGLYGNSNWTVDYDNEVYQKCPDKKDDDCLEDKLAKILLNGGCITLCDTNAEDEEDFYGDLHHCWDDGWGMNYMVTIQDIEKGLNKAAKNGYSQRVKDLAESPENLDMWDADILLQVIVYGEYIYG